ncbi:MalM family protein [Vibrio profundum]|uniref:MalM family protein n=1 Tax=Vibrio profundum TaxID=2910247 RepID=UPI003D0BCD85
MNVRILLLIGCMVLSGCVTTVVDPGAPVQERTVHSVFELHRTSLRVPSTATIAINQHAQYLKSRFIDSPVAAFEIPSDQGVMSIKISSTIKDSVFYPSAVIMDAQGSILTTFNGQQFHYQAAKFGLASRLVAKKTFRPPFGQGVLYLLIYTKTTDVERSSRVVNPAYWQAKVSGAPLPEKQYIQVPHATQGIITVNLEDAMSGGGFATGNDGSGLSLHDVSGASSPHFASPAYNYQKAIEKAVAENDIGKALELVKQAQAQGIPGMREVFANAMNVR